MYLAIINHKKQIIDAIIVILIITLPTIAVILFHYKKTTEVVNTDPIIQTDKYNIKIDYPDIEDRQISKNVKEYISENKKNFIKTVENLENPETEEEKYDFIVQSQVENNDNIETIHIITFYHTGEEQYTREDKTFHYDINTDEEIDITYFLANETSLQKLSTLAYYYLMKYSQKNQMNISQEIIQQITSANVQNFSHFSLKDKGLEILFPPERTNLSINEDVRITIPYKKLTEILKQEYIKPYEEETEPETNEAVIPQTRDLEQFRDKKLLAFTFDDGPSQYTTKLLDGLGKYNAKVTFFVLGNRVGQYSETIRRAYLEGNQIGSHTYNHLNLLKLEKENVTKEIVDTNIAVENVIFVQPTLLRPPYGNFNKEMKETSGMCFILWNVDTEDWKTKDAELIANHIVEHAQDGNIVLLHDLYETSVDGALLAMERLQAEGYAFVTIQEMSILKGIPLETGKAYYDFQ